MTTTVKVHVNGNYIATVTKVDGNGSTDTDVIGTSEQSFGLSHPAAATFTITERPMTDEETATRDAPTN